MAKMKYWNGTTWEILDAKDADTVDGKHASATLNTTEKNDLAGAINEVKSTVDAHKSENAASAHKDKNIAVVDANNHFTGTTLNAVLDELFTFANDGKTNLAAVIGSPAAASNTFTQLKDYIQADKNTLATNLTNKGQSSTGTETLAALAAKVANVNTGKKFAVGTISSIAYKASYTVSGLSFVPKFIILSGKYIHDSATYIAHSAAFKAIASDGTSEWWDGGVSGAGRELEIMNEPTSGSFVIENSMYFTNTTVTNIRWVAFEEAPL